VSMMEYSVLKEKMKAGDRCFNRLSAGHRIDVCRDLRPGAHGCR
jgi:hypothetical protein